MNARVQRDDPGDDDPPGQEPRTPNRWSVTGAAVAAIVVVMAVASAGMAIGGRGIDVDELRVAESTRMIAPDGVVDMSAMSPALASEYRFAEEHADQYAELRCWCGCEEAFSHRSLFQCFVRDDGQWEAHGAGCGICIAEAITARERLAAGVPLSDVARELDLRYGPTRPPSATDIATTEETR